MTKTITDVLDAAKANLDVVRIGDHSGFYRHADIERMVYEIENLHSMLAQIRILAMDQTIDREDALILIADLAGAA